MPQVTGSGIAGIRPTGAKRVASAAPQRAVPAQQPAFAERLQAAMRNLARTARPTTLPAGATSPASSFSAASLLPKSTSPATSRLWTPTASSTTKASPISPPGPLSAAGQATAAATSSHPEPLRRAPGSDRAGAAAPEVAALPPAASPARPAQPRPLALADFPRPAADNGRGVHWIPTTSQSREVVDRFVEEAKAMKMKWVVFLNNGTDVGPNDYLVTRLAEAGIMPVMRVYTPNGAPVKGDLAALVRHYLPLGVHYYQLYNEPNLSLENQGRRPDVASYLDKWIPAAKEVARAGGLPGFGALAPGGEVDDLQFLREALDGIIRRGEEAVLDKAWLSVHNYLFNRPLDHDRDSNGFAKFRWYDRIVREKLGRSLPMIGTEGGTHVGAHNDSSLPPVSDQDLVRRVMGAYEHVGRGAEPYNFAYTYWLLANEAGGGTDPSFSHQALIKPHGASPLVEALKRG